MSSSDTAPEVDQMDPMVKRLYSTTNAAVWADEFMQVVEGGATVDWGLMVGWFANAFAVAEWHHSDEGEGRLEP